MSFVITLDGPAGAGKSSVAKRLAKILDFSYLDTGALYRATAYYLDKNLDKNIIPSEYDNNLNSDLNSDSNFALKSALEFALKSLNVYIENGSVFVNKDNVTEDVTDVIRTTHVDSITSLYSALKPVRDALLDIQRKQADYGDLVTDGRDMGTVVFPEADVKIYLTATAEARAERRYKDLLKKGGIVLYSDVLVQMRTRDRIDIGRELSPLREPEGSIYIDTSYMSESDVVEKLLDIIKKKIDY